MRTRSLWPAPAPGHLVGLAISLGAACVPPLTVDGPDLARAPALEPEPKDPVVVADPEEEPPPPVQQEPAPCTFADFVVVSVQAWHYAPGMDERFPNGGHEVQLLHEDVQGQQLLSQGWVTFVNRRGLPGALPQGPSVIPLTKEQQGVGRGFFIDVGREGWVQTAVVEGTLALELPRTQGQLTFELTGLRLAESNFAADPPADAPSWCIPPQRGSVFAEPAFCTRPDARFCLNGALYRCNGSLDDVLVEDCPANGKVCDDLDVAACK